MREILFASLRLARTAARLRVRFPLAGIVAVEVAIKLARAVVGVKEDIASDPGSIPWSPCSYSSLTNGVDRALGSMTNHFPSDGTEGSADGVPGAAARSAPATQAAVYPTDALVAVQAGLIFVTTGQIACHELGADLDQVALTPAVAWRIAEALREALQHSGMHERRISVGVWSASEVAAMPHGKIKIDERFVEVGIEPLGAGARVTVAWDYVPGLIVSLENAVQWSQAGG